MRTFIRSVIRFLTWPGIRFVNWAIAQHTQISNDRLLARLDVIDPSLVHLYDTVRITAPERCTIGRGVSIHGANWNAAGGINW